MKPKEIKNINEFKLCYVEDNFAYFTRKELHEQWGDDWNDAPYEHNAGRPYYDNEDEILMVAYRADLQSPCDNFCNSPYSVQDINNGAVAWLYDRHGDSNVAIHAGCGVEEFIDKVHKANGCVYIEVEKCEQ